MSHIYGCPDLYSNLLAFFFQSCQISKRSARVVPFKMFSCFLIPLYEKIDTLLEKHGDFDSLQKFRLSVAKYYLKHDSNSVNQNFNLDLLLKKILEFDLALRYTTQREEYLKRSYKTLITESNDERDDKQLLMYLDELNKFSKSYRLDKRQLCALESLLPSGPFRRAYDTWRSNPKWYLHPYIVAHNGGCCSRQCGCCQRREPTPGRQRAVGHCTIECGCRAEARGFELEASDRKEIINSQCLALEDSEGGSSTKALYSRYMRAFFFGTESKTDPSSSWN